MLLLLIETCGQEGLLALATGEAVLREERLPGRGSSEHLLPALRRLFTGTGTEPRGLGAVAVVHGPGSFTGVRVGLAAAKGLCEAVGCRLVAISRLRLLLLSAQAAGDGANCAVLDAGRGEFFIGWRDETATWHEQLLGREAALLFLNGRSTVAVETQVAASLGAAVRLVAEPDAEALRTETLRRLAAGETSEIATTDANYLRRTDAELLRER